MDAQPRCLDDELESLKTTVSAKKAREKLHVDGIRDILDVNVLKVMEAEESIFSALWKGNHFTVKKVSCQSYQLSLICHLPLVLSDIKVQYLKPGFVALKMPANLDESFERSDVWQEELKKSQGPRFLRNLKSWINHEYLSAHAFNRWLGFLIERSLVLVEAIPNFEIEKLDSTNQVVLKIRDKQSNYDITVTLLPVFQFLPDQLPQSIIRDSNSQCHDWNAECRPHPTDQRLWGISLTKYECVNVNVKYVRQLLKAYRDGLQLRLLSNYHIKTLVLLWARDNQMTTSNGEILLQILKKLHYDLISQKGIPFFWDVNFNILTNISSEEIKEMATNVNCLIQSLEATDVLSFMSLPSTQLAIYRRMRRKAPSHDAEKTCQSGKFHQMYVPETFAQPAQSYSLAQSSEKQLNIVKAIGSALVTVATGFFLLRNKFKKTD